MGNALLEEMKMLSQEIMNLAQFRDTLLPKLMNGECTNKYK